MAERASRSSTTQKTSKSASPTKKGAAKKTAPRKTTARKTASRKTAPSKAAPSKTASSKTASSKTASSKTAPSKTAPSKTSTKQASGASSDGSSPRPRGRSAAKAEPRPPARASQVGLKAASELLELTGKAAEGVTGLERTEDGWTVQVEVVEVRRIPDTTDVLALYEVQTDSHGSLLGYRRVQRYTRGSPGDS
jgi:hypothetical protein